jgi:hypothetical protein
MIRKFSTIILVVITTLLVYGGMMYLSYEDNKVCDELVIMNDGSQIEATSISSYENGMSCIKQCNGEEVRIPTLNIKIIKPIQK